VEGKCAQAITNNVVHGEHYGVIGQYLNPPEGEICIGVEPPGKLTLQSSLETFIVPEFDDMRQINGVKLGKGRVRAGLVF
jgi:hypothetical protein